MDLTYRKATLADLDVLTQTRVIVLRVVWKLPDSADMSALESASRDYYSQSLADGSHTACLAYNGDIFAGTGGICYFQLMPTWDYPSGRKAYIMNMYTLPEYRGRGVATGTLDLLVQDARARNVAVIALETSEMGRKVYAKYGFVPAEDEMLLNLV